MYVASTWFGFWLWDTDEPHGAVLVLAGMYCCKFLAFSFSLPPRITTVQDFNTGTISGSVKMRKSTLLSTPD